MGHEVKWTLAPVDKFAADEVQPRIAAIRALGADPRTWARFGPEATHAAEVGPSALHAWGKRVQEFYRLPDTDDQNKFLGSGSVEGLLFAIQVYVGDGYERLSHCEHRSLEELSALAGRGDSYALSTLANAYLPKAEIVDMLEQRVAQGDPAAMFALATLVATPSVPEYRQRLLLERAGALGHAPSWRELGSLLERLRSKDQDAIEAWRRGAALGDKSCQWNYANALDAGKHVRRDAEEAYRLYEGLENWSVHAWVRCAQMLWDGDGVNQDRSKAVHLFFKLALMDGGAHEPLIYIGDLFQFGLGGMQIDLAEAKAWYELATYANYDVIRAIGGERLRAMGVPSPPDKPWELIDDLDPTDQAAARCYWSPCASAG